jgi:XTP/dITP diphosphohydrolase
VQRLPTPSRQLEPAPPAPCSVSEGGHPAAVKVPRRMRKTGLGYDPVHLVPEVGLTYAQMAPAEKHRWSHRAAAVRTLLESGALSTL